MQNNNIRVFSFPELDIDLHIELQSLPVRIHKHNSKEQIGTALIEAAGVGQGVVKLLYIDTTCRASHLKQAHKSLIKAGAKFGFIERLFQRKKAGKFLTFLKRVIN